MLPSFLQFIFYSFAFVAILSAIFVITTRNPVRSVLSLVITFFALSGIWMILRAEFLSLILLLVYVGAVMTLFLFVVMMLSVHQETKYGFIRYWPFALLIAILTTGIMITTLGSNSFGLTQLPPPEPSHNLRAIAHVLYTDYVYLFEIAGVILLAAMIATITLTHRGVVQRKVQNPSEQIAVRKEDRIRLMKMPPTPRGQE